MSHKRKRQKTGSGGQHKPRPGKAKAEWTSEAVEALKEYISEHGQADRKQAARYVSLAANKDVPPFFPPLNLQFLSWSPL